MQALDKDREHSLFMHQPGTRRGNETTHEADDIPGKDALNWDDEDYEENEKAQLSDEVVQSLRYDEHHERREARGVIAWVTPSKIGKVELFSTHS
jgi:hypothetical protein